MSRVFFTEHYRDWAIQNVWDEEHQRWDSIATKGETRLDSNGMSWYQFTVVLDRADGRSILEDFIERLRPEVEVWPWTNPSADLAVAPTASLVQEPLPKTQAIPFMQGTLQSLFGDEVFA